MTHPMYALLCVILAGVAFTTQAQNNLHQANQKRIDDLRTRLHTLTEGGENTDSLILMLKEVIRQQSDSLTSLRNKAMDYRAQARRFNYSPVCNCHRIFYDLNRHEANYATYTELDSLATLVRNNPSASLRLVGHADRSGPAALNQILALKRAESLKHYLITKHQLPPTQINTEGRSNREPIDGITDPYLFHLDRRVEIFLIDRSK